MDEAKRRDWTAVRAAYERGEESIAEISRRFGVPTSTIYNRRDAEGWTTRQLKAPAPEKRSRKRRRQMVARFFETLARQMHDVEQSLAADPDGAETSSSGRERDARTLASLVRTLEKLVTLDTGPDKAAKARKDAAHRDIDGLREALAERIRRFAEGGSD